MELNLPPLEAELPSITVFSNGPPTTMKSRPPTKKAKLEQPSTPQVPVASASPNITPTAPTSSTPGAGKGPEGSQGQAGVPIQLASPAPFSGQSPRLSFPPLPYPELQTFPRLYNTMTSPDPLLPIDDVDNLQYELESLWTQVNLRIRLITAEQEILESIPGSLNSEVHYDATHAEKILAVKSIIDSGHGTRTSVSAAAKLVACASNSSGSSGAGTPSAGRKAGMGSSFGPGQCPPPPPPPQRQPKKKLKVDTGLKVRSSGVKPARAGQNRQMSMDDSSNLMEAPSQFWEFADSYCREVTSEDIETLDRMIQGFKSIPKEVYNIPELGVHFAGGKKEGPVPVSTPPPPADTCGPLTQRLVAALVEDRVSQAETGGNGGEGLLINRPGLVRALGLDLPCAGIPLEQRLRQVLQEQGLMLPSDDIEPESNSSSNDEILAEIKRTFSTLNKLHKHNVHKLEQLSSAAKSESARSNYKKELEKADKEVIDAYRAIASCRLRRKPLTQKEKNGAAKALANRQNAIEKLGAVEMKIGD